MNEQDYLADPAVAAFASFLCGLVCEGYPDLSLRAGADGCRRQVATLGEVVGAYSWRGESFAATNRKIDALRDEMRAALEQCAAAEGRVERRLAELELLFVSNKALSWGQVYEGAFGFLIHQAETEVLSNNLCRAAALLDGSREDVDRFDDNPFRSDCGMTKVYAAMNRRSVVYEDRFGAAMGLLCRHHLERQGETRVPELLAFMAGESADSRRNASRDDFLFPDKNAGREHARWNLRANWIVSRVADDDGVATVLGGRRRDRMRLIEAALFMVGDDVRDQPSLQPRPRHDLRPSARGPSAAGVHRPENLVPASDDHRS